MISPLTSVQHPRNLALPPFFEHSGHCPAIVDEIRPYQTDCRTPIQNVTVGAQQRFNVKISIEFTSWSTDPKPYSKVKKMQKWFQLASNSIMHSLFPSHRIFALTRSLCEALLTAIFHSIENVRVQFTAVITALVLVVQHTHNLCEVSLKATWQTRQS